MPGIYYLYRHIRLDKNEPFYIGIGTKQFNKTTSYKKEYARAFCSDLKAKGRNIIWKRIYKKCKGNIEVQILLESNDYAFIKEREIEFIKIYGRISMGTGSLANLTDGGEGINNIGEETRLKLSINKKKYWTPERRRLFSEARKGIKFDPETIQRMSDSKKFIKLSETHKLNISKGGKGKISTQRKPVLQFTKDGIFINTYASVMEAAIKTNTHENAIRNMLNGRSKTANNYVWKFKSHNEGLNIELRINNPSELKQNLQ